MTPSGPLSGLPPGMRADYRRGIDLALKPGGLLVGVWFINPDLDPGEEGPPFGISVPELTALFADGYEIVEDYVPAVAFKSREGRERLRVLRRTGRSTTKATKCTKGGNANVT